MCTTVETVGECLGKPVFDPYGRKLGHIVSFYSDIDGKIRALEVNLGDLGYKEVPVERIRLTAEGVILVPEHEYDALLVENRLKLIKARLASIEELYSRKELATHVYENLKKKLEEELTTIKSRSKEVKENLRKRLHEIEEQIAEVEKAMGALKTSYLAGEIQEKPYLTALDIMKKSLETLLKEKDEVKKHLDKIESLEALPLAPAITLQQSKEPTQDASKQPMNVVVVG